MEGNPENSIVACFLTLLTWVWECFYCAYKTDKGKLSTQQAFEDTQGL